MSVSIVFLSVFTTQLDYELEISITPEKSVAHKLIAE